MHNSEEYEQELLKTLIHLNDPAYQPSETLFELIGLNPQEGVLPIEVALLRAIEDLKPITDTPTTSQNRQYYDLLHKRFVQKLTQEETAEHLHVSRTSIHRLQLKAVHILARSLWRRSHPGEETPDRRTAQETDEELVKELLDDQVTNWNSQVQYEIASLEKSAPRAVSNVGEVIENVQELITPLISRMGSRLEVRSLPPDLDADVHPSILSQMLIMVLERLGRLTVNGRIELKAELEGKFVNVELNCPKFTEANYRVKELVSGILVPEDISIKTSIRGSQLSVFIDLPSKGKVTVLVVDDNIDMALLYRRSTEKTRFQIIHIQKGEELFEKIESVEPDIIVLDIMLPDVDGWRLLMRLQQNPATKSIPVIICSVVRDEVLALSLGATLYLSKPVRPRQFLQALNQVSPQASTAMPIDRESS